MLCRCFVVLCALLFAPAAALADLASAQQLYADGRLDAALAEVDSLLADDAADPEVRFLKGIIFADEGRADEAIEVFAALTQDYPELPEPYNNLAVLFVEKGEFEKAREALLAAIHMQPSYSTAHENLGDLYAKMASEAYDRALQEDGGNESARTKLTAVKALFSSSAEKQGGPTPAKDTADPAAEVTAAVERWRAAWSAQDTQGYMDSYASDFAPADMSHADWAADRRDKLDDASYVRVTIDDMQVAFARDDMATVEFVQTYEADDSFDHARKTLTLFRTGDRWEIVREDSRPL